MASILGEVVKQDGQMIYIFAYAVIAIAFIAATYALHGNGESVWTGDVVADVLLGSSLAVIGAMVILRLAIIFAAVTRGRRK